MAFSVEMEDQYTEVVILDPTGDDMDLTITHEDSGMVWLKQVSPDNKVDLICITDDMFADLVASYTSTEGFYRD